MRAVVKLRFLCRLNRPRNRGPLCTNNHLRQFHIKILGLFHYRIIIHLKIANMILQIVAAILHANSGLLVSADALEGLHVVSDMVYHIKHPV